MPPSKTCSCWKENSPSLSWWAAQRWALQGIPEYWWVQTWRRQEEGWWNRSDLQRVKLFNKTVDPGYKTHLCLYSRPFISLPSFCCRNQFLSEPLLWSFTVSSVIIKLFCSRESWLSQDNSYLVILGKLKETKYLILLRKRLCYLKIMRYFTHDLEIRGWEKTRLRVNASESEAVVRHSSALS